jgi:hypothetical protein
MPKPIASAAKNGEATIRIKPKASRKRLKKSYLV